jgi:hypothetical protein
MKPLSLLIAATALLTLSHAAFAAPAPPLPLAPFMPGTMSRSFAALAPLSYEYKAPVFASLGEAALKLNGDRPELDDRKVSPAWFMILLTEPFIRDVQSPIFSSRVIRHLDRAIDNLRKRGIGSIDRFPKRSSYDAAALRALAAAIRASREFVAADADQALAQSVVTACGRAVARLEAGQPLDPEARAFFSSDSVTDLLGRLASHPRTRGLAGMAARSQAYLRRP